MSSASEYLSSHYRADGLTAHLAKRIEGLVQPGNVLISGATFRLVEQYIEATSLGTRALAGFDSEVELYELLLKEQRPAGAALARSRCFKTAPLDSARTRLHGQCHVWNRRE